MVAFSNREVLVGEVAKRQAVTNVDRTISSGKERHMGTDWKVQIDDRAIPPGDFCAYLVKLKQDAEAYLGDTVTSAVITGRGLLQ